MGLQPVLLVGYEFGCLSAVHWFEKVHETFILLEVGAVPETVEITVYFCPRVCAT
jgi:hypothetical protein